MGREPSHAYEAIVGTARQISDLRDELATLKAERDELVKALEEVFAALNAYRDGDEFSDPAAIVNEFEKNGTHAKIDATLTRIKASSGGGE